LVDKPEDTEGGKSSDEREEVVSMVDVLIQQDTSTIPTKSTPTPTAATVNTDSTQAAATHEITTNPANKITAPGIVNDNLSIHDTLEKHASVLKSLVKLNLPHAIENHGRRLYKLEHLDLEQKVSQAINEQVAEAVSIALEAPLRSRFKDLHVNDMKVILQHTMYQIQQHKGHEAHVKLYNALEASIKQDNAEEHAKDMEIERKRKKRRQDHPKTPSGSPSQPPPPPPSAGAYGPSGTPSLPGGTHAPSGPSQPPSSPQQQTDKTSKSAPPKQAKQVKYAAWTTIDVGALFCAAMIVSCR
jgi:hypothetical protein